MSNDKISVPRELAKKLEQALKIFTGHDSYPNLRHHYGNEWWEPVDQMRDELRALLAQPNTVESLIGRSGGGMEWHECAVCKTKGSYHPDVKWCICGIPFEKPAAAPNTCAKDGGQCGLGGYCEPCRNVESAADHHWNCPNCPPPGATHTISGQFYRKADGSWLVFGHKRDWVPSDAPAGWNDTNLVPLLPEPALARCTCPSGDGSLRWPCPVHPASETHAEMRLRHKREFNALCGDGFHYQECSCGTSGSYPEEIKWCVCGKAFASAEPQSPAQAPVLPERKPDAGPDPFGNKGWNAYDDELKRLNPTL